MGNTKNRNIEKIKQYNSMLEKQMGCAVRPYRFDGYVNMLNKYGTAKDTTEHYQYNPEPIVADDTLSMFYESNGLFSKIIDTPAEEAVKHGFELEEIEDQNIELFIKDALDLLDWEENAMTAIKWARLFGGSIIVMLIDDGGGLEDKLNWRNIRSIEDLRVYDRSLIQPDYSSMYDYDPSDQNRIRGSRLGMPEYYTIASQYGTFKVHESRCLVFQNGLLPENTTNSIYQMWGVPEYLRIHRAIRDAEIAHGSGPKMLDRSIQAIYKMKNLSEVLATDEGEDVVLRRLQTIDMARGMLNSITIDSEGEDYDFRTFQFNGVADIINTACNYLSALTSIPQTILFGRSPAGMNATGDSDLENYYNFVERIQKRMLRSNLRYLLSIIFKAGLKSGEIEEMPKISVKFNPLWSMSEGEQAALDLQKAQLQQTKAATAQIYVGMQALDPSEVRKKLAETEEFDVEDILDDYDEDELFEQMNAMAQQSPMGGAQPGMGMAPGQEQPTQEAQPEQAEATPAEGSEEPTEATAEQQEAQPATEENPEESAMEQDIQDNKTTTAEPEKKIFEEGSFSDYANNPQEGQENPEKAMDSDLDGEETNVDGGPGSGNFGHEGVPGQVGGSAPSADNLNEGLKEAYSSKDYVEVQKKFRKTLKEVPVGSKFTSNGKQYTKTGEDEFESEGFKGRKVKNNTNMVVNSMDAFDVSKAPVFDEIKSEDIAEAKGVEKYGQEKKVPTASSTKSNKPQMAKVATSSVELFRSKDSSEEDRIEVVERIKKENPMYDLSLNGSLANTLANKTGMNNPPELMSEKEFDNYVEKNGALKIYRGVIGAYEDEDNQEGYHSAEEFRNEFETSKDSVYGGGNYGSGYHFSTEYRQARGFANSSNGDGTVFECAIKPNARIISEKELDSHESEWEWNTPYKGDSSAWAIAHGYDMVRKGEGDGRVVLVLNRNALIMKSQKANTDSSEENLGSVGILVVKDGKFLCGTRHNDFGYGLMCGPGGHIEKGESPEYAAIREADEEFSIIPTELISLGTGPTEPDTGLTPHLFLCTEYEGEPASGDLEITNIKFRSLEELEDVDMFQPFIDGIYQFLDSLVKEFDEKLSSETNISEKPIDKYANSAIITLKTNSDGGPGSGNHGHKGIKGHRGGSKSQRKKNNKNKPDATPKETPTHFMTVKNKIKIEGEPLSLRYGKKGDKVAHIMPGETIEEVKSFAGKGSEDVFVNAGNLAKDYGDKPKNWAHKKGNAMTVLPDGKSYKCEVHWFESDEKGQVGWKVKKVL